MSIVRWYPKVARSYGPAPDPLAIVWHMAEGGNTAAYLTSEAVKAKGNSSHIVIEGDGDVVGVLSLNQIAGSIRPSAIRTNDDPSFVGYNGEAIRYGVSETIAVLGSHHNNPNPYSIQIEIEGFAAKGPNKAQRIACVLLSRELRARFPTLKGNLAHRDFQNYKRCPGRLLPWANMGGHGVFKEGS